MRPIILAAVLALAAAPARAADPVPWSPEKAEFKYFQEQGTYDEKSWEQLPPADQDQALREAKEPAAARQQAVAAAYHEQVHLWNTLQLRYYSENINNEELKTIYLWMGAKAGHELAHKVAVVKEKLNKAQASALDEADVAALRPYLTEDAIAGLRSMKAAEDLKRQAAGQYKKHEIPKASVNAAMKGISGAVSGDVSKNMAKAFDGSTASGDAGAALGSKSYALPKRVAGQAVSGVTGQISKYTGDSINGALAETQRAPSATTVKSAAPARLEGPAEKSKAWTSDAYGITIETAQGKQSYRDTNAAEAAIRKLPAGSIKKITLYGHGSPGMQTVGPNASYDSDSTAQLLKGKMGKDGVIQFSGCNTSSIGGSTLNPAVGLSMVARRLLYFSVPYFQDRADGVPSAQAREQWEKGWNADLARDTSVGVKGAIVCGYRTFGLVPGRLPGLTKLMGSQEATEPGYVAGKKACYQDGKEVPVP